MGEIFPGGRWEAVEEGERTAGWRGAAKKTILLPRPGPLPPPTKTLVED